MSCRVHDQFEGAAYNFKRTVSKRPIRGCELIEKYGMHGVCIRTCVRVRVCMCVRVCVCV